MADIVKMLENEERLEKAWKAARAARVKETAKVKAEKGVAIREEANKYLKDKYGLSLQAIMTATDKAPKVYLDTDTGEEWSYTPGARKPVWLKGHETEFKKNDAGIYVRETKTKPANGASR